MVRRKKKQSKRKVKPSLSGWAAMGILALPALEVLMGGGTNADKINKLKFRYAGVDSAGKIRLDRMATTYIPPLVPLAVKKVAIMLAGRGITRGLPVGA